MTHMLAPAATTVLMLLTTASIVARAQENPDDYKALDLGPYEHVYPPPPDGTALLDSRPGNCTPGSGPGGQRCPLYFTYMSSLSGGFVSGGSIPGVQIALDQINDDPSMLPGYTLHYIFSDSKVSRADLFLFTTYILIIIILYSAIDL